MGGKKNSGMENSEVKMGELYLFEVSDKIRIPLYQPSQGEDLCGQIPRDEKTGNVHMIPDDIDLAELCSMFVKKKAEKIQACIEAEIKGNKERYGNIAVEYKDDCGKNKKLKITRATMVNKTKYKDAGYLFSYASVISETTKYDLIFNRFFFDNNRVSCILLCFQIEMYDKKRFIDEQKASELRTEPPYTKNYPQKDEKGNGVYYNFDEESIYSPAEDIAKAFLDFVIKTEEEKGIN